VAGSQYCSLAFEQANDVSLQLRRVNDAGPQRLRHHSEWCRKRRRIEIRTSHLRNILKAIIQELRLEVGSDPF
jgi:hypothetical protein